MTEAWNDIGPRPDAGENHHGGVICTNRRRGLMRSMPFILEYKRRWEIRSAAWNMRTSISRTGGAYPGVREALAGWPGSTRAVHISNCQDGCHPVLMKVCGPEERSGYYALPHRLKGPAW